MNPRTAGRALLSALGIFVLAGCADMKDQPRFEPFEKTPFFPDGRASRPLVDGTVPRGFLREDDRYYRGLEPDGTFVAKIPAEVDAAMLARGRNRYDIFCSPCHSMVGNGQGMIVARGYKQPTSYHDPRLRGVEDGYIFDVITNGFGQMSSYASQVKPADRWAIVAYIRALQLSQFTDVASIAPDVRQALERGEEVDVRQLGGDHTNDGHGSGHGEDHNESAH